MKRTWTSESLTALCAADGEFRIASRFWTGGLWLDMGDRAIGFSVVDGAPTNGDARAGSPGVIALAGAPAVGTPLLAARPPRFFNDLFNLTGSGQITVQADPVLYAQYYPAVMRALELMRPADPGVAEPSQPARSSGTFDSPVGRYVHLELGGQDHRIYFEEAGPASQCCFSTPPAATARSGGTCSSAPRSPTTFG